MKQGWDAVDRYIEDKLVPNDDVLRAALLANAAAGLPSHDVPPPQGRLLHLLARMCGARRVLEIETLGGYSTVHLSRAPTRRTVNDIGGRSAPRRSRPR